MAAGHRESALVGVLAVEEKTAFERRTYTSRRSFGHPLAENVGASAAAVAPSSAGGVIDVAAAPEGGGAGAPMSVAMLRACFDRLDTQCVGSVDRDTAAAFLVQQLQGFSRRGVAGLQLLPAQVTFEPFWRMYQTLARRARSSRTDTRGGGTPGRRRTTTGTLAPAGSSGGVPGTPGHVPAGESTGSSSSSSSSIMDTLANSGAGGDNSGGGFGGGGDDDGSNGDDGGGGGRDASTYGGHRAHRRGGGNGSHRTRRQHGRNNNKNDDDGGGSSNNNDDHDDDYNDTQLRIITATPVQLTSAASLPRARPPRACVPRAPRR